MVTRAQPVADVTGRLSELRQVLPDAEPAPGARDDDSADGRIARLLQRGAECLVHGGVECIEDIGTVQRDRQDGAVPARLDLGHEGTLADRRSPKARW